MFFVTGGPEPELLVVAAVIAVPSFLAGSVLGFVSIFSRSARNRLLGTISVSLIWALSALLFLVASLVSDASR